MIEFKDTDPPKIIQDWAKAIQLRDPDVMASFYAEKAILIGTFSNPMELRKTEIREYFDEFLSDKNGIQCQIMDNINQLTGNCLISSGVYLFSWDMDAVYARYSFICRANRNDHYIINQHSSLLPY